MIWVNGRIVPDDELKISVMDRTFEHGLGLFETLRTWNGRAVLLERHLDRLQRSAQELGLPLDLAALPDRHAVFALFKANQIDGDALLRITLTGGLTETKGSTLWMRTAPLPPPIRPDGATVAVGFWEVSRSDRLARYKTLNYWLRRIASEQGRQAGFDEVLSRSSDGFQWEGARTNIFLVTGDDLLTPTITGPVVPGVMREVVLEHARDLPLSIFDYVKFTDDTIRGADEVFLTNSVRGIIPVARVTGLGGPGGGRWGLGGPIESLWQKPVPGPWTQRLSIKLYDWLQQERPDA